MRYLLDAEVLMEALRPEPNAAVGAWIERHIDAGLAISALALAQLQAGVSALGTGPERNGLGDWLLHTEDWFEDAVLAFDDSAARPCARMLALGAASGRPVGLADAMTAGVAEANGLILACRSKPWLVLWGGRSVDPWSG